jgi:hypothetical protein
MMGGKGNTVIETAFRHVDENRNVNGLTKAEEEEQDEEE